VGQHAGEGARQDQVAVILVAENGAIALESAGGRCFIDKLEVEADALAWRRLQRQRDPNGRAYRTRPAGKRRPLLATLAEVGTMEHLR
jgi:hypothetical protein